MSRALLLSFWANLLLAAGIAFFGPPVMAIHFGLDGTPDNWASKNIAALIWVAVTIALYAFFRFLPKLMEKMSGAFINLPNKDYWLSDEHRKQAECMLIEEMNRFGATTFALLFVVEFLALQANLTTPVRLRQAWVLLALGTYILFVGYWVYRFLNRFKLPPSESTKPR